MTRTWYVVMDFLPSIYMVDSWLRCNGMQIQVIVYQKKKKNSIDLEDRRV